MMWNVDDGWCHVGVDGWSWPRCRCQWSIWGLTPVQPMDGYSGPKNQTVDFPGNDCHPRKVKFIWCHIYIYIYIICLLHIYIYICICIYMIDVTTLSPSPRHDRPSHRMLGEPNSKPLDPWIQAGGPTLVESTGRLAAMVAMSIRHLGRYTL